MAATVYKPGEDLQKTFAFLPIKVTLQSIEVSFWYCINPFFLHNLSVPVMNITDLSLIFLSGVTSRMTGKHFLSVQTNY